MGLKPLKVDKQVDVPVNLVLHVTFADVKYLNELAEERGCGYGDPGKIELIRRLFIDGGIDGFERLNEGDGIKYTIKES